MSNRIVPMLAVVALVGAAPALAVDGVQEINHAAIVASGGYPWAATTGNYRLTSDLRPTGSLGISLEEDNIVIDFNGFALIGDGSAFDGVNGGPAPDGHTLCNGAIRGFGGRAVTAVAGCTIEGMQVSGNAGGGLQIGPNCLVRHSRISSNGGIGGLVAQGTGVAYESNIFFGNAGGDVAGATSIGVNLCDGLSCASPPRRRFYLTSSEYNGDLRNEQDACAAGFHHASIWEIWDPSSLQYDTQLGLTLPDSGEGPPTEYGWIRTGGDLSDPDLGNCNAWGSDVSIFDGAVARPSRDLDASGPAIGAWQAVSSPCDQTQRLWCVQE